MALELLPEGDARRPRLLGRLGIASAWALTFDDAVAVAAKAGDTIAEAEGKAAAAEYLSDAAYVCAMAGGNLAAWDLARQGLTYASARDVAWARLLSFDYERRAAEDPHHPGVPIDSAERRESARILREARLDPLAPGPMEAVFDSREEALTSTNLGVVTYWAGEYPRALALIQGEAEGAESLGRLTRAARCHCFAAFCLVALGHLDEARTALARARALAARLGTPLFVVVYVQDSLALATDDGWDELTTTVAPLTESKHPALAWGMGLIHGIAARAAAHRGQVEEVIDFLGRLVPWLEHGPAWTVNLPIISCHGAEVLWLLERLDHADVVERALREKVVAPDFRSPMVDARLGIARLCALHGRQGEAVHWFGEARRVLSEQDATPLRAITDFDEALMYVRRGGPGDINRARPLFEAAHRQFQNLGMTGWLHRVEELSNRLG